MAVSTMDVEKVSSPAGWGRRMVTTPTLFASALLFLVFSPLLLVCALVWDMLKGTRLSACRTVLFLTYFLWFESLGLTVLFWHWLRRLAGLEDEAYEDANRKMQRWWVKGLFAGVTKLFDVRIEAEGISALDDARRAVILSRHASTLDTLLPMVLSESCKRFRYVLKAELLMDPALDYCGQRLPNAFVQRGSEDSAREVNKIIGLGQNMSVGDAVVLYPEGTRFTPAKRRRLLEKFADVPEMRGLVESFRATLPPLREGALSLLRSTPCADVVFITHRGLSRATTMRDLIGGGLTGAHLEVLIWRVAASEVPRDEEGLRAFMLHHWQQVDAFAGS